jgi:hypothetical protein
VTDDLAAELRVLDQLNERARERIGAIGDQKIVRRREEQALGRFGRAHHGAATSHGLENLKR